ncbi:MAG: RDD family protein [Desulfuromonadales bacterium]|nr:RDD family protein [Desulfuromonadales bacterium]
MASTLTRQKTAAQVTPGVMPKGEIAMLESPTILRRYLSTFIDGVFILSVVIFASLAIDSDSALAGYARIAVFLGMFFLYEPIFTSRFCTLGQKITGIRVRTFGSYENISIPAAYLRIIIKILLGFISLLSIPFTKDRRAVHDFASGSVVIMA